jgi:hypothetical protein
MNSDTTLVIFSFLITWMLPGLLGAGGGYFAGLVHFKSLKSVADRLVAGDMTAVALQFLRFAALSAALLSMVVLGGAIALLAATAGLMLAKWGVLASERIQQ